MSYFKSPGSFSVLACLALASSPAIAVELIADFYNDTPNVRTAAFDPGLTNLNTTNWASTDNVALNLSVVVKDAGNQDITGNFSVDLTGVAMRWELGAAARFASTFRHQQRGSRRSGWLAGVSLPNDRNLLHFRPAQWRQYLPGAAAPDLFSRRKSHLVAA